LNTDSNDDLKLEQYLITEYKLTVFVFSILLKYKAR